jgi:hypothetical protein
VTVKKADRRKSQRKEKLKERKQNAARSGQLEKAAKGQPKNEEYISEMGRLAHVLGRTDIELKALLRLHEMEALDLQGTLSLRSLLANAHQYAKALNLINATLRFLPQRRVRNKKTLLKSFQHQKLYCEAMVAIEEKQAKPRLGVDKSAPKVVSSEGVVPPKAVVSSPPPEIQIHVEVDPLSLRQALTEGSFSSHEDYELALEGYRIRFSEAFENLICISQLQEVRSFWYQEETVRKVMKIFRGRALLADEVGLGKTIEALMILKEYALRGMVKSALILVPSPLVGQWKDELATKFQLPFLSTEETAFRSGEPSFWNRPFVLASINVAKSPKNFPLVTQRKWDLVILDEAHHVKNRNTLNWKLVNNLKKRFLLLLTATPVENNLMELHNLVTLLKPGQLKTAAEFKREFMTSGDPTDPRNRKALKELLGEIMVRNTRALAKIGIPPRFAQTVKVESLDSEKSLYGDRFIPRQNHQ